MKVLLVNGSPREKGCTYTGLSYVEKALNEQGIETEIFWLKTKPVQDCIACGKCRELGKCVFDDLVNEFVEKAKEADGFVFGTPVYYAHPSGRIMSFMDRVFYSNGAVLKYKPAAVIASSRRAGSVTSMDVLNKHLSINQMPIVSSTYWNEIHGNTPEQVLQDEEGIATMINIGQNMAWLLKCIELGKQNGVEPVAPVRKHTNFIR